MALQQYDILNILVILILLIFTINFAMSNSDQENLSRSNVDTPLSMVTARKKLRKVEDKIYEARHRIDILGKKLSRVQYEDMNKTRVEGFKGSIRNFAHTNHSIKQQYKLRRSVEIQNTHELNMQRRAQHKQKLQQMKAMISTQNRWVYENIRKQREANEQQVRKQRSRQHEKRRQRRDQMFEEQQRRTAYLKQFLKHKHLSAKLSKEEETNSIQAKILERERLLAKLQRQGSEMSVNPQLSARSKSIEGGDSRVSKGFRINSRRKQQKEVLQ